MSNLILVPNTGDELPSQQVSRRIRGWMAEYQITGRQLSAAMHMDQATFSRRYSGKQPWSYDEMVTISRLLGRSIQDLCANRDLNPEPADLRESGPDLQLVLGSAHLTAGSGTDESHDEVDI